MIRRMASVLHARNLEFLRDRGTLVFTLLLPVMLVIGMGFVFGGPQRPLFKVGVLAAQLDRQAHPFLRERYVEFVPMPEQGEALHKLTHQQIDLLVDLRQPPAYWVNTDSPKGYMVEKLLLAAEPGAHRQPVTGAALRYVDWLFPGILGMNMMFSCLFGVGYVVLRYRKSGFLKRLHATPLSAFEFLSAQVLSRLGLILFVTIILYAGIGAIIRFRSAGSLALLMLLAVLGALSMIALGLTVAARFSSEELVGGILNLLTWPMMLLSGIWFSLEGAPRWVQWVAHVFPLTHVLDAARAVMLDGAGLAQIAPNLLFLAITTLAFLALGAWSFRWRID
ncbi:MAG TPA: ABC transporter permease [Steroidobacteraceae bacterium]|jgi:ABC-2 type transport system permease protein|nr:ABC transporter permease [Steroidobacteraceae bacterium]